MKNSKNEEMVQLPPESVEHFNNLLDSLESQVRKMAIAESKEPLNVVTANYSIILGSMHRSVSLKVYEREIRNNKNLLQKLNIFKKTIEKAQAALMEIQK
ncbi:hypothetical protein [Latilactobacillus sakei]|uniref:hypothetical protein n=1 Tax=Latilactobacillus sakei TaxID=1599 RepID=UPI002073F0D0|nr:hypothetical protein [Latilactobacillus sakei]USF96085.1 hypothetical protein A4W82_04350 [Latilactobacillus sakei]